MTQPSAEQVFATVDATWPAAQMIERGPWTLRQGLGGGQRVSAATTNGPVTAADIDDAEAGMRDLDQHPLFMITKDDKALDADLAACGYACVDPVSTLAAPTETLASAPQSAVTFPVWPPLAVQREIWATGGIYDARLAVMDRAKTDKITHLGRVNDAPAATAYTAIHGDLAMLHALEVAPDQRRHGLGAKLMAAAAHWAMSQGARWIAVLVVDANTTANAFYKRLGMKDIGVSYHYRKAPAA